jgi:hypothetical protein
MKKLIPILVLIIAGCTSPNENGLTSNESTPQNSFVVPVNWQEVVPDKKVVSGKQHAIHTDNIFSTDGRKVSLEEFNELILSGSNVTVKFYVDESEQTNAVVDVVK